MANRASWPGGRALPRAARARPRTKKSGSFSGVASPRMSGGRASTTTTAAGSDAGSATSAAKRSTNLALHVKRANETAQADTYRQAHGRLLPRGLPDPQSLRRAVGHDEGPGHNGD
eukprot:8947766-Pyramimonas_sp.AAC.1